MPIRIRCPECQALMQVPDNAAGKRTKCPKCEAIVAVPATASGSATPGNPASKAPAKPPGPTPPPHRPPAAAQNPSQTPNQNPSGGTPKTSGGTAAGNVKQVRCPRCQQVMRAAAGSTVQCPNCQTTVRVPGSGPGSSQKSQPSSGFDFGDLPSPSLGPGPLGPSSFGLPSLGPAKSTPAKGSSFPSFSGPARGGWAPAGGNPYASGGATYTSGGHGGGDLPSGRSGWHYTIPGAIFDILGALMILGSIANIGLTALMVAQGMAVDNLPMLLGRLGGVAIGISIAVVYLMGGSAMIRRRGLTAAKAAAVVACIPCFNCLGILTPIGIWACILVFSDKAQRDFRD